jgi:protein-disulfide isomerase
MRSATLATPITEEDHAQGPANATITLVRYGDYECPYTRLARHSVRQLQREFPDSLRFVFRHFPLEEIHPHARAAAAAGLRVSPRARFCTARRRTPCIDSTPNTHDERSDNDRQYLVRASQMMAGSG